jgi:hypothetical protein
MQDWVVGFGFWVLGIAASELRVCLHGHFPKTQNPAPKPQHEVDEVDEIDRCRAIARSVAKVDEVDQVDPCRAIARGPGGSGGA